MTDLPFIGRPARQALEEVGVTRLEQLAGWSRRELLALHGVGPKAIRLLEPAMAERGLAFKPDPVAAKQRKNPDLP